VENTMLNKNERLCKCGCRQIIDIKQTNYLVRENKSRNSYYVSKYHLGNEYKGIEDWAIEKGVIKEVLGVM
jgi:hypothetical protein